MDLFLCKKCFKQRPLTHGICDECRGITPPPPAIYTPYLDRSKQLWRIWWKRFRQLLKY